MVGRQPGAKFCGVGVQILIGEGLETMGVDFLILTLYSEVKGSLKNSWKSRLMRLVELYEAHSLHM